MRAVGVAVLMMVMVTGQGRSLGAEAEAEAEAVERSWYGWQIIALDVTTYALVDSRELDSGIGLATLILGAPLIHGLNGRSKAAGASLIGRASVLLLLFATLGGSDAAGVGLIPTVILVTVLDWSASSERPVKRRSPGTDFAWGIGAGADGGLSLQLAGSF